MHKMEGYCGGLTTQARKLDSMFSTVAQMNNAQLDNGIMADT